MSTNEQQRIGEKAIQLAKERCLLVAAVGRERENEFEDPLDELAELIDTAGGEVVGRVIQRMEKPNPKTYLNKGRFEELAEECQRTETDTLVIDDRLSPAQLSHLEETCQVKVIDRNEVILDIFCSRAQSAQAKLQVELAQLEYELPRLARKWTHLERLGGGIGTRGPGETQIETDRRIIRAKIAALKDELAGIVGRKTREVKSRSDEFTACIVGYTNAGKSTLMNRLTGANTFVEDRLFATLDTLTRKLEFGDNLRMLISDTVGFIRRLPANLVASFHATLEEAAQADLLLHVIDASDPMARDYVDTVHATLAKLGMGDRPRLYVLNKCDRVDDRLLLEGLANALQPAVVVSALTGQGIDELLRQLVDIQLQGRRRATLLFPSSDGRRLALANECGRIQSTRYEGEDVIIEGHFKPSDLERLKRLPGPVQVQP